MIFFVNLHTNESIYSFLKVDRKIIPAISGIAELNIERPEKFIMPNGMVMNVINTGKEDVIRLDLVMRCGQLNQRFPLQAMMTNRMLREGTRGMTSAQIAEKLDFYGAWLDLSSSVNCGFITLYSLGKFFDRTIEVLAEMVKAPVFPERELRIVADTNKQMFMVNAKRVDVMARKRLNREMFGEGHPLGRFAEEEDYDNLSTEMLRGFYEENYSSDNCTLFVAGRVTDGVMKRIEECLGKEKWGSCGRNPEMMMPQPAGNMGATVTVEKKDAMQSSVKVGAFMPDRKHEDFQDLKVMNTMLGGYFGSRLMKNIREDKGYTYGVASGIVAYPGLSLMVIGTETANEYVEEVMKEMRKEIERMKTEMPDREELEMVKNYMMGDICRAYENALSVSEAWIYVMTAGLDMDFFDKSIESIRNISEKRIMELADRYLDWNSMVKVVAGKV